MTGGRLYYSPGLTKEHCNSSVKKWFHANGRQATGAYGGVSRVFIPNRVRGLLNNDHYGVGENSVDPQKTDQYMDDFGSSTQKENDTSLRGAWWRNTVRSGQLIPEKHKPQIYDGDGRHPDMMTLKMQEEYVRRSNEDRKDYMDHKNYSELTDSIKLDEVEVVDDEGVKISYNTEWQGYEKPKYGLRALHQPKEMHWRDWRGGETYKDAQMGHGYVVVKYLGPE